MARKLGVYTYLFLEGLREVRFFVFLVGVSGSPINASITSLAKSVGSVGFFGGRFGAGFFVADLFMSSAFLFSGMSI
jgi:hypothetical protein